MGCIEVPANRVLKIICLHGTGTNVEVSIVDLTQELADVSQIFKKQTSIYMFFRFFFCPSKIPVLTVPLQLCSFPTARARPIYRLRFRARDVSECARAGNYGGLRPAGLLFLDRRHGRGRASGGRSRRRLRACQRAL
jgi:hypothetical protein